MDFARKQTDKRLDKMEREIGRVYADSPALKRIKKEYAKYMKMVQERTKGLYKAYSDETDQDIKAEAKKAYMDAVRSLTVDSKEYNALVKKFVQIMAQVNQQALDITNDAMTDVYTLNYNQVATECRRVGIKVDGKE